MSLILALLMLYSSLFIASFLKPMTWALYVGSVLVGVGAAGNSGYIIVTMYA